MKIEAKYLRRNTVNFSELLIGPLSFKVPYFTHYMIAIINNCLHAMELSQQMRTRNGNKGDQSGTSSFFNKFEILSQTYDVGLYNVLLV